MPDESKLRHQARDVIPKDGRGRRNEIDLMMSPTCAIVSPRPLTTENGRVAAVCDDDSKRRNHSHDTDGELLAPLFRSVSKLGRRREKVREAIRSGRLP